MAIQRRIEGDKAAVIDYLREERADALKKADLGRTRRERDRARGRADGLWFAIRVLEDWTGEGGQRCPQTHTFNSTGR